MLIDKFLEGDTARVKEIMEYLEGEADEDYMVFYPHEKWLLLYETAQYKKLIASVQQYDSAFIEATYSRIRPMIDDLFVKLTSNLSEQRNRLLLQIKEAHLDKLDQEFLEMNLGVLLPLKVQIQSGQASLNEKANNFLTSYPNSKYEYYVRHYIRNQYKPTNWGASIEFFTGYGIFTNNLGKSFQNNIPVGVAFDIFYRGITLFLRDYIGFSKTKDSIMFQDGTWKKNAQARVFLPEASIGYSIMDNKYVRIIPYAGISATLVSPTQRDRQEKPEYEDIGLESGTSYVIGMNIDIKLGNSINRVKGSRNEQLFGFTRIRYGYTSPKFERKYDGLGGDMHFITIGFGGFTRPMKRDY